VLTPMTTNAFFLGWLLSEVTGVPLERSCSSVLRFAASSICSIEMDLSNNLTPKTDSGGGASDKNNLSTGGFLK
jgi:hypothetical protein